MHRNRKPQLWKQVLSSQSPNTVHNNSIKKLMALAHQIRSKSPRRRKETTSEVETLLGDPSKAKTKLGWQPTTTLDEMIEEMIGTDLIAAQKNRLLVREGYEVNQTQE
jgi:GDP-D-mannose dehydratase